MCKVVSAMWCSVYVSWVRLRNSTSSWWQRLRKPDFLARFSAVPEMLSVSTMITSFPCCFTCSVTALMTLKSVSTMFSGLLALQMLGFITTRVLGFRLSPPVRCMLCFIAEGMLVMFPMTEIVSILFLDVL